MKDQSKADIPQQSRSSVGLKIKATLAELQVKLAMSQKDLADIKVGGVLMDLISVLTLSLLTVPSPKLINFPKLQTG